MRNIDIFCGSITDCPTMQAQLELRLRRLSIMLRLVLFYMIGNEGPKLCEWTHIRPDQRSYPKVAEIIRQLPGWSECRLMRFERIRDQLGPTPIREAVFGRLTSQKEVEVITVHYYAGHPLEETTTREEFRAYLKTLAGIIPSNIMARFIQFSRDPETHHVELNQVMNLLLAAGIEEAVISL
ncbi:MAG: hypothetical protein JJE30_11220 [Desulfuromonadales bacterium]|nr:hypothetical protein [Desulfuromonadales bacterium]